jgi:predicted GTPase
MPYGDLLRQVVQRFSKLDDLDRARCSIEEREEYTPYLDLGVPVFAGVDYRQVLACAETEADVLLWDGGNNDYPFLHPDLSIVVADALRPHHECRYHPGESNFRAADLVVVNKVGTARRADVAVIREHAAQLNPRAALIEADLEIQVDDPAAIRGRRVLVVEDGPTLTHGGMGYGAGLLTARKHAACEVIDPRPFAAGSLKDVFCSYPHIDLVLPACGYSPSQVLELQDTIQRAHPDIVVDASPAGLAHVLHIDAPVVRVRYGFRQVSGAPLGELVDRCLATH